MKYVFILLQIFLNCAFQPHRTPSAQDHIISHWSIPKKIVSPKNGIAPFSICASPNGNLHIVYCEYFASGPVGSYISYIKYMKDDSNSFIIARGLQYWNSQNLDEGDRVANPSIFLDNDGIIHITYTRFTRINGNVGKGSIEYRNSTSWSSSKVIAILNPYEAGLSSIVVDKEGVYHVAYTIGQSQIGYVTSRTSPVVLAANRSGYGHAKISIDKENNIYVAYSNFSSIEYISKKNSSNNWTAPNVVHKWQNAYWSLPLSFTVDPKGVWHLLYLDWYSTGNDSYTYVKYKSFNTNPTILATGYLHSNANQVENGENLYMPVISTDEFGGLHASYIREKIENDKIASTNIEYITVPKLIILIPGINDNGNGLIDLAKNLCRFDLECTKNIREKEKLNSNEVIDQVSQAYVKAIEKTKDVIINVDMDIQGYGWQYFIPPIAEGIIQNWHTQVKWAGITANIISREYFLLNAHGVRSLFSHSAGVDALKEALAEQPGNNLYDYIVMINGRTKTGPLCAYLEANKYRWWQVKLVTSAGDFWAAFDSVSNFNAAYANAGKSWIHIHHNAFIDGEYLPGHSGFIKYDLRIGNFSCYLGTYGSADTVGTSIDMLNKDWRIIAP
jgi:hypothetical protein